MRLTTLILLDENREIYGAAIVEFMASYAEARWVLMQEALSVQWSDPCDLWAYAVNDEFEFKLYHTDKHPLRLMPLEKQTLEVITANGVLERPFRYSDIPIPILIALFHKYATFSIEEARVLHIERSC